MESQFQQSLCPFHDGPETLDGLLAEIDPSDIALLDAALDLRCAYVQADAAACVAAVFRLRHLLDGRHYLAFYRIRRWLHRTVVVQVRLHRGSDWHYRPFPLDGGRPEEIENTCLAALNPDDVGSSRAWAQIRYGFALPMSPFARA